MPKVELYDYQLKALEKMKDGCILCGIPGSGKSRTALAYYYTQMGGRLEDDYHLSASFLSDHDCKQPLDLYIITTAKKRDDQDWESEMTPFLMSSMPEFNTIGNKIFIDSWNNIKKYAEVRNAFFIFDEQRVVGYGTWAKSFIKIARNNRWILLSATPGDVWKDYIAVFIANGFYKNKSDFERQHVIFSRFKNYPSYQKYINVGILTKHRNDILIPMHFQKRTKTHTSIVMAEYDPVEYKNMFKYRFNVETGEPFQNAGELCYALRKLVNSDISRQIKFLEILEEHPKVVVFYNYDYELEILRELLRGADVPFSEWNGHKHEIIPKGETWAYLVQYTAGSEGWNCIATDTTIFFSQSYSYKAMIQARGRIDRLNTPYTDLYYFTLKTNAPIDIAIGQALRRKEKFNADAFVGEMGKN